MATLRNAPLQALDVILFRGVDPVSHAICFLEARKFGHAPYPKNLLRMFSVVFPAQHTARDNVDRALNRIVHFRNVVLERARRHKPSADVEHRMFCSEWVAMVYKRLGLDHLAGIEFDPHLSAPVAPLLRPGVFAAPVFLEPGTTVVEAPKRKGARLT